MPGFPASTVARRATTSPWHRTGGDRHGTVHGRAVHCPGRADAAVARGLPGDHPGTHPGPLRYRPERKTDPGEAFDWSRYRAGLTDSRRKHDVPGVAAGPCAGEVLRLAPAYPARWRLARLAEPGRGPALGVPPLLAGAAARGSPAVAAAGPVADIAAAAGLWLAESSAASSGGGLQSRPRRRHGRPRAVPRRLEARGGPGCLPCRRTRSGDPGRQRAN